MNGQRKVRISPTFLKITPRKAGLRDLSRLLGHSDLRRRDFVDSSDETGVEFKYRWLIFISTAMQKLLMFFSTPLALVGLVTETWLNFLSYNPTLCAFIKHLFNGTLIPHRDSADYVSFIGHLDDRKKWDSDIKNGDGLRYFSALCMMASKAAYENKAYIESIVKDWEMVEFLEFHNCWNDYQNKATTGVYFLRVKGDDHDTIVVAFRGTKPFSADDWCTDWDLSQKQLDYMGSVHEGFMRALGLPKDYQDDPSFFNWPVEYKQPTAYYFVRDKLKQLLNENEKTKFLVTGHSLGGALAILFPTVLLYHDESSLVQRLDGVYTYGQPRVGDGKFAEFMECKLKEQNIRYLRFVYDFDMVPRLPYDEKDHWYKHFGKCLYYDCHYQGKVVSVLPNKNYFSVMMSMNMIMSAIFELIRSFTIQYTKGSYYKEGWLSRSTRVIGLVIPGVSDHSPQGYVNITCLGSPEDLIDS
ncbi:triacylglycerol lipase OBL1-like [Hibiscus syriacus]|uniref:triacylglycerol lipase OBL1-like n=1 Tax=Hibiscus syriacus TaxID=106335 RepID=UPI001920801E|nr:triacylglycerol lipase OBL1-like [Hibiscus syriacus]